MYGTAGSGPMRPSTPGRRAIQGVRFVQPVPGVTEMYGGALTLTGAVAVERDGEVVDADECRGHAGERATDQLIRLMPMLKQRHR